MKQQRKEDAVSPVIGVMLMLVVTIIIAAVITGFATELSSDTSSTPMALFESDFVEIGKDAYGNKVNRFGIAHKGGDSIPLKDIQITYVTDSGGSMGLLNILDTSQIGVVGKEIDGKDAVISTGDIITVSPLKYADSRIDEGSVVSWTISYTKSNGVIVKGKFVAIGEFIEALQ